MSANFEELKRKLNKETEEPKKEERTMSSEEKTEGKEMSEREYVDSRIDVLNEKLNDYASVTDKNIKELDAKISGLPSKKEIEIIKTDIETLSEEIGQIRRLLEKSGAGIPRPYIIYTAVSGKYEADSTDEAEAKRKVMTLSGKPVDYVLERYVKKVTKIEEAFEPLTEEELDNTEKSNS